MSGMDSVRQPHRHRRAVDLDLKDMNDGGDGPHGVMSAPPSGKTTALRTVIEAIMLGHSLQNVQMVLARPQGRLGRQTVRGHPARGQRSPT